MRVNKVSGAAVQTSGLRWAPAANTDQHKPRPAKPSPEPETTSLPVVVNALESSKVYDDGNQLLYFFFLLNTINNNVLSFFFKVQ